VRQPSGPSKSKKTEAEWRRVLTPAQFDVLRRHATGLPGSSALDHEQREGTFACAGCDLHLFSSLTKFDSGTGWPSFYRPLPDAVETEVDRTFFMTRTEVHCRRCGGHLGHVFDDGPSPAGLRCCMNGVALARTYPMSEMSQKRQFNASTCCPFRAESDAVTDRARKNGESRNNHSGRIRRSGRAATISPSHFQASEPIAVAGCIDIFITASASFA
jgi:peptide-methionine (R)-S-oxide reductase